MPKLQAAGWDNDPHSIAEQRFFTDGRIVVRGNQAARRARKRADYILRYTRDFALAVVEAKSSYSLSGDGIQQAKEYAQILGLKFAYATNGEGIVEFDFLTGKESEIESFPGPEELWSRLRAGERLRDESVAQRLLTPTNLTTGKEPRYYQHVAINWTVQAILQGKRRALLTMATGTGKTVVAFHICGSCGPRSGTPEVIRPGSRESCIWLTAIFWWMIPRTKSLRRLATRDGSWKGAS